MKKFYSLLLGMMISLFVLKPASLFSQCAFTASVTSVIQPSGVGCDNGFITITAVSTTGYVFYDLYKDGLLIQSSFGFQTYTFASLSPGSYQVKVTNNGCFLNTEAVDILEPECDLSFLAVVPTDCSGNGCNDGSITVKPTGGYCTNYNVILLLDGNYYGDLQDLFNGEFFIAGLPAGNYSLILTTPEGAASGCRFNQDVTISSPPCDLQIGNLVLNPASAFGCLNGKVNCTLSGSLCSSPTVIVERNGAYYATLNNLGSNNYSFNFLPAGNFNLIAYNDSTCADTVPFTITQPACNISVTNIQVTDVTGASCGNGAIQCNVGGNSCGGNSVILLKNGLFFQILTNNNGTYSIGNLQGGQYKLVARSLTNISCADTVDVTVNEAACNLQITNVSIQAPGGNGCSNGAITFRPLGSTCFGYAAYLLDSNSDLLGTFDDLGTGYYNFTGLSAGSYTIYLTNSLGTGCTVTQTITINDPPCNITLNNIQIGQISVAGCSTGTVSCTASGNACSSGAYDVYLLKDGILQGYLTLVPPSTIYSMSGLSAGNYTLVVENYPGSTCQYLHNFTLSNPACNNQITAVNVINSSSAVTANGSVSFTASGTFCSSRNAKLFSESSPGNLVFYGNFSAGSGNTFSINGLLPGNYRAVLSYDNFNACNDTELVVISIANCTITPTITAGGPLSFCPGGSVVLTSSPGTSYLWSNGQTTQSITVNGSGNYTVFVTDASSCTGTSAATTVTQLTPPVSYNVSGGGTICPGSNSNVNLSGSQLNVNYTLYQNGVTTGNTLAGTGSSLSFNGIGAAGNYTVQAVDINGCSSLMNGTAVVTFHSTASITFNTTPSTCNQSNASTTAVVSGGSSPFSFLWNSGQTTAQINNILAGNYTVTVTDANTCTVSNSVVVTNGLDIPVLPVITGPPGACKGQNGVVFTVNAIPGAASYNWTLPTGASGSSTTNSITVNFSSTTFNGGNICVSASNICGTGPSACLNLQVFTTTPATPASINGPASNVCGGTVQTYTAAFVSNAATYTWTAAGNTTILSGQGTQTITLQIGANFTSGTLSVKAQNCKGVSGTRTLVIYGKPGVPASITGPINAVCGGSVQNYSCPVVAGAASYNWTIPAGCTINSGQGTNAVSISFPVGYITGTVSVQSVSTCGSSTNRSVTVRSVPIQPSTIVGTSVGLCGGGSFTYTIAAVTGATSYTWSVPSGCTITANSGTSITVNISNSFVSGSICVTANNSCGSSTSRCLTLSKVPAAPTVLTGPSSVCSGQLNVSYSTPSTAGLTYTWTVPAGVTIVSGQGTANLVVNWGTSSGTIGVRAGNACGLSNSKTLAVTVVSCREQNTADFENQEMEMENNSDFSVNESWNVYPNPAQKKIRVERTSEADFTGVVRIYSVTGELLLNSPVYTFSAGISGIDIEVEQLPAGIYLIEAGDLTKGVFRSRIVKE